MVRLAAEERKSNAGRKPYDSVLMFKARAPGDGDHLFRLMTSAAIVRYDGISVVDLGGL